MFNLFINKHKRQFLRFVGYFTAHLVWQTQEGNNIAPLVAYERNARKSFQRYESDDAEAAKQNAQSRFEELQRADVTVLFIHDGYLQIGDEEMRSLLVEATSDKGLSIKLAIPYQHGDVPKIFAPKVIEVRNIDIKRDFVEFYNGVYKHEKAWSYWKKHLQD